MYEKKFKYCPLCSRELEQGKIEGKLRKHCLSCGWINYKNPLPAVICVVKDPKGRVLVAKRSIEPGIGRWALPGGFMEWDESPEQACVRELKEETGLEGKVIRLLGVYMHAAKKHGNRLLIGYEVRVGRTKVKLNSENSDAKFVAFDSIPPIPFPAQRHMLKAAARKAKNER